MTMADWKKMFEWIKKHAKMKSWMRQLRKSGLGDSKYPDSRNERLAKTFRTWGKTFNTHSGDSVELKCKPVNVIDVSGIRVSTWGFHWGFPLGVSIWGFHWGFPFGVSIPFGVSSSDLFICYIQSRQRHLQATPPVKAQKSQSRNQEELQPM